MRSKRGKQLMSNDGGVAMHPEFPRWYREVDVGENRERLQGRWNGVSAIANQSTNSNVESLLTVAFGAKKLFSDEGLRGIRQQFKDADDFFEMSGNDRELE